MLCQSCAKELATVHLVDIQDSGEKQEIHICERCAQDKGVPSQAPGGAVVSMQEFIDILKKNPGSEEEADSPTTLKCDECGITYEEFRSKGRFGCAKDYDVFGDSVVLLLEKIQGTAQYMGKIPERSGKRPSSEWVLLGLKQRLHRVVQEEQYEEAAKIRDQISALELNGEEDETSV